MSMPYDRPPSQGPVFSSMLPAGPVPSSSPMSGIPYGSYGIGSAPSGPNVMSAGDTLAMHLHWAFQGLRDALSLETAKTLVLEDPEIQAHAVRSAILNVLSIASVAAFDILILPLLDPRNEKWFHRHFGALYQAFWLAPLVAISLYLNLFWCSRIASRTFALKHGRQAVSASPYSGMVAHIASSAYRGILIASYLILTFLFEYVPYVGTTLSFIYICWVNAYYCFE
ncbi:hypothetical protein FRB99_007481 [Tulasnella sp. 403]|nr:hypothetical protein FRB99_007481 [Tulasnella sp. 403]